MGVTCIEMMPVNDFPGRFGWGYDGVNLFAPTRLYGEPDDLKRFIDAAHAIGIGVILDVVYNHLGPDGNYLACFAPDYFTKKYKNEWGEAINFDGPASQEVRAFFIANAAYWVGEYHFDGLRLDATQSIFDDSEEHVIAAMARAARAAAGRRSIILVGENEPQHTALVRSPEEGGYGLDALWNDDFHHSAMVVLAGRNEAYYEDHEGEPSRHARARPYAGRDGQLRPEPRPDRQFRHRPALSFFDQPGAHARHDGAPAADARDADAVPGTGVLGLGAFLLFRRPQDRTRRARA
jgi:maltooligosyltrehalose trehalohydrolase